MEVTQYIFQSPYTSSVQVGRVDPATVKKEEITQDEGLSNLDTQLQDSSPEYLAQTSSASAINVVSSSSNSSVSAALEKFSSLNTLAQAKSAFEV